jgi:hypothetical protein
MKTAFSEVEVSVEDRIRCFLTTGSGMEETPDPGSGLTILDHNSESLVTISWVKNNKFLCCGFGGSGKNIQDPQHW